MRTSSRAGFLTGVGISCLIERRDHVRSDGTARARVCRVRIDVCLGDILRERAANTYRSFAARCGRARQAYGARKRAEEEARTQEEEARATFRPSGSTVGASAPWCARGRRSATCRARSTRYESLSRAVPDDARRVWNKLGAGRDA